MSMIERHRLLAAQSRSHGLRSPTHATARCSSRVMSDPTPTMFAVGMSGIADAICGPTPSAASLRADLDVGFLRHLVAGMERRGIVGTYWCSKPGTKLDARPARPRQSSDLLISIGFTRARWMDEQRKMFDRLGRAINSDFDRLGPSSRVA